MDKSKNQTNKTTQNSKTKKTGYGFMPISGSGPKRWVRVPHNLSNTTTKTKTKTSINTSNSTNNKSSNSSKKSK